MQAKAGGDEEELVQYGLHSLGIPAMASQEARPVGKHNRRYVHYSTGANINRALVNINSTLARNYSSTRASTSHHSLRSTSHDHTSLISYCSLTDGPCSSSPVTYIDDDDRSNGRIHPHQLLQW